MIVLDTHAWLWWVATPALLGPKARDAIDAARRDRGVVISAISAWEVAMLVARGRLQLTLPVDSLVESTQRLPFVTFDAVDPSSAVASVGLDDLHPDPADRIIAATAIRRGATLVTKDQRLSDWGGVATVW